MKRSVYYQNTDTKPPYYFLNLVKSAFDEQFINSDDRLEHSAILALIYMGALRVNEALKLFKGNFMFEKSNEGFEFLLLVNVNVEKKHGIKKSTPLPLDDPLTRPILAHIASLRDDESVFSITDRTVLNIIDRLTAGQAWTHWLRSQRASWLSSYLTPYELEAFCGWGRRKPRKAIDFYIHRQWRDYADKIAHATRTYWANVSIEPVVKAWLDSLTPAPATTTTVQNRV